MASYKEFTTHLMKHGLARTNRFQVLIPLPPKMLQVEESVEEEQEESRLRRAFGEAVKIIRIFTGGGNNEVARGLDLMCSQTELPGKNINVTETKYNGDTLKMGHSILYGVQQFAFKVSGDMYEKNILDEWMNCVVNPVTHEVGYMDDYVSDITIFQLDSSDRIVHGVVLKDAWPTMANPLVLSNMETNNVHELMCQFSYRRWENIDLKEDDSAVTGLAQTPLGPFLTPILSNPVIQRGLDYFENATGIDLEGEAINIYNQVDDIIRSTTGESIGSTIGLLNSMKVNIELNDKITPQNAADLLDIIEGTIDRLNG